MRLLPLPAQGWDYKHASKCLVYVVLGLTLRALGILGRHPATEATSPVLKSTPPLPHPLVPISKKTFFFFFFFPRQGFFVWLWLSWSSLCGPGWPRTQRSACLCLPSAGIFFFFLFEGRFQYIVLAGLELQKSAYFCFLNAGIKVYIFDHQTSASTCKPCTRKEERFKGGREVQAGQTTNSLSS